MTLRSKNSIKVLAFDVFGTVVDWRSSIIAEGERLGKTKRLTVDWAAFADAWRAAYVPSMDRVRNGGRPWVKLDVLHRMSLNDILRQFNIEGLSENETEDFNRIWHRLEPWPDSVAGLERLKKRLLPRSPTATSHCSRIWPSMPASLGTAFSRLNLSAAINRTREPIFLWCPSLSTLTPYSHDGRRT